MTNRIQESIYYYFLLLKDITWEQPCGRNATRKVQKGPELESSSPC
jgi:hypothetical protein